MKSSTIARIAFLAVLAAASMTLGSFAAIPQSNTRRLLAYSSIAHAGYVIIGLVAVLHYTRVALRNGRSPRSVRSRARRH